MSQEQNMNFSEQLKESPEKPTSTIDYILSGRAKITFSGKSAGPRTIGFREFEGDNYSYLCDVPSLSEPGKTWQTELCVWFPAAYYPEFDERLNKKPGMQIYILTGQGDMLLTKKPEIIEKVYREIRKQTDGH